MSEQELSFQQLDPVGGYGVRPVTLLISVGVVTVSALSTLLAWPAAGSMLPAYLAVVATAVIAIIAAFCSSPLRAPFSHAGFVVIGVLQLIVLSLAALASWVSSSELLMGWASLVVGLTIAQLAPYRPTRELVGMTVVAGITAGFIVVLKPLSDSPALVTMVNATVPLLALGIGGIAYSSALSKSLRRWYSRSRGFDHLADEQLRERIVRSVQEDRVGILSYTVVPFFTDLLQRGELNETDRNRAREIAASIRSIMVADVDRSWLDTVVDQVAGQRADSGTPGSEVVEDPDRLAAGMTTEQRTVIRALIIALFDHPGFDPDGFGIVLSRDGTACLVALTAKLDADDSIPRSGLAAYFAVLRIAFGDLQLTFHPPTLTLRFSYEHT